MYFQRMSSKPAALFGIFTAALLALNAQVLVALVDLARRNNTASHVVLVPLVTLVLIYQDRSVIFSSRRPAPVVGAGVVLLGLAVTLAGSQAAAAGVTDALSISVAGLVVAVVGGFLFAFGWHASRAALFPLVFLGFTVPLPYFVIDGATQFLKVGSTEVVAWLFTLTRTPFYREGYVFALPTTVIEIADACSGIRSSIGLMLTGLLACHTFLQRGWTKAVLLGAVLPMTVLKNGIRIVSLSLLAMYVDPEFLTGQLHHEGGIVFFGLALALLAPVLLVLRRLETHKRTEQVEVSENAAARD
jgi:exosortase